MHEHVNKYAKMQRKHQISKQTKEIAKTKKAHKGANKEREHTKG